MHTQVCHWLCLNRWSLLDCFFRFLSFNLCSLSFYFCPYSLSIYPWYLLSSTLSRFLIPSQSLLSLSIFTFNHDPHYLFPVLCQMLSNFSLWSGPLLFFSTHNTILRFPTDVHRSLCWNCTIRYLSFVNPSHLPYVYSASLMSYFYPVIPTSFPLPSFHTYLPFSFPSTDTPWSI